VPYAEFADPQSLNLYTYVRNIPTTRVDNDGHVDGVPIYNPIVLNPFDVADGISDAAGAFWHWLTNGPPMQTGPLPPPRSDCPQPKQQEQNDKGNGNNSKSDNQSEKSGSNVQENRKNGLEYEKKVLDERGLDKNTKPMEATDPKTGKSGTTIPDSTENGATVEVKGGKSVSDSRQLRLQTEVSKPQKAQVVVKPGTKVSKTVRERMDVKENK
jgi:hypothetical protein